VDTGLVYAEARYYSPTAQRFFQEDPSHVYLGHQGFSALIGIDRRQILLDPQQLNSYSYVRNNPVTLVDPDGMSSSDFFSGYSNALLSNQVLGAGRIEANYYSGNQGHFQAGQTAGDFASLLTSSAEMVGGSAIATGGAVVTVGSGGLAIAVSMPTAIAGAILTAHGIEVAGVSLYNISSPKPGSVGGPGAGKGFGKGTKQWAYEEADGRCVFCGQQTTSEVGPLKTNTDHAVPKSRNGNNLPDNAQNTCRTCNLKKGAQTTIEFIRKTFTRKK